MKPYRPVDPSGNLYYVRLTTPIGTLYKLGFTKLLSVNERLAFGGRDDDQLIDKVLYFGRFHDAFDIEQSLHGFFRSKAPFEARNPKSYGPLFGNGQSELYFDDVLELDVDFTEAQVLTGQAKLKALRDQHEPQKRDMRDTQPALYWLFSPLAFLLLCVFGAVVAVISTLDRLFASSDSRAEQARRRDDNRREQEKKKRQCDDLLQRLRTAHKQESERQTLAGDQATQATAQATEERVQKLKRAANPVQYDLRELVEETLSCLRSRDLIAFLDRFDLDASALNFAAAVRRTSLCEQGTTDDAAAEGYKWLLDAFLLTGRKAVNHPDLDPDPILDPAEAVQWQRMGHEIYKHLGGDGPPLHAAKVAYGPDGAIDVKMFVLDAKGRFFADLVARVNLGHHGRLIVSFPNLAAVLWARRSTDQRRGLALENGANA